MSANTWMDVHNHCLPSLSYMPCPTQPPSTCKGALLAQDEKWYVLLHFFFEPGRRMKRGKVGGHDLCSTQIKCGQINFPWDLDVLTESWVETHQRDYLYKWRRRKFLQKSRNLANFIENSLTYFTKKYLAVRPIRTLPHRFWVIFQELFGGIFWPKKLLGTG